MCACTSVRTKWGEVPHAEPCMWGEVPHADRADCGDVPHPNQHGLHVEPHPIHHIALITIKSVKFIYLQQKVANYLVHGTGLRTVINKMDTNPILCFRTCGSSPLVEDTVPT